jgi:hypothetical protein
MTKKRKSRRASPKVTLASITKEMAQPRFAESARKEEDANHHVTTHPTPPKRAVEPF